MKDYKILALGDSYSAARESDTGLDAGWPVYMGIKQELRMGVSGSTAFQWSQDFDGRLNKANLAYPDIAIMSLLGNDAMQAMADGTISILEMTTALTALRFVATNIKCKRLIVLLYADPFHGLHKGARTAVPLINSAIVSVCPRWTEFYDTAKVLYDQPEYFDGRDIHPTMLGHKALAMGLWQYIDGSSMVTSLSLLASARKAQ